MSHRHSSRAAMITVAALALSFVGAGVGVGAAAAGAATASPIAQPILQLQDYSQPTNDPSSFHFGGGGGATATTLTTTAGISVTTPGPQGDVTVQITPPDGKTLATGTYQVAYESTGLPVAGVPDVTISTPTQENFVGRLDILDLASNAQGVYTRFDVILEGVGEIRMGESEGGSVVIGQRHMAFARFPVGFAPQYSQETLLNTAGAAVAVGAPTVKDQAAADFAVSSNTCGTSLAAGASCSFRVGFSPKAAGPRIATLRIPLGATTQYVSLTGSAPLGTTSIITSGKDYIDGGGTLSYVNGPVAINVSKARDGWAWYSNKPYETPGQGVYAAFEKFGGGTLALGSHTTQEFGFEASGYGTDITAESRGCGTSEGTENVKAFTLDSFGVPSMANIAFTQTCEEDPTHPMTGTLLWQSRSDTTAPNSPTAVALNTAKHVVAWKTSTSTDSVTSIARLIEGSGARATPLSGTPVAAGAVTSATLPTLQSGVKYTVVVFAVDKTGNVSKAGSATTP